MKPITLHGCACVIGRVSSSPHSPWIVREPTTGLAIANARPTRKAAIAEAEEKIRQMGQERFRQAIAAQPAR